MLKQKESLQLWQLFWDRGTVIKLLLLHVLVIFIIILFIIFANNGHERIRIVLFTPNHKWKFWNNLHKQETLSQNIILRGTNRRDDSVKIYLSPSGKGLL